MKGQAKALREVFVVDYLRTPFSRSRPSEPERDVYNSVRMDQALALLIRVPGPFS